MSFDLIVLGVFQGLSWSSLLPWEVSTDLSIPFWAVRLVAGLMMFVGLLVFMFNICEDVRRVSSSRLTSWPSPRCR